MKNYEWMQSIKGFLVDFIILYTTFHRRMFICLCIIFKYVYLRFTIYVHFSSISGPPMYKTQILYIYEKLPTQFISEYVTDNKMRSILFPLYLSRIQAINGQWDSTEICIDLLLLSFIIGRLSPFTEGHLKLSFFLRFRLYRYLLIKWLNACY